MSLERFLRAGKLRRRKFQQAQINELARIAERDLNDAAIADLSTDRRFFIAYEAALTVATIPLNCAGYETSGPGAHWVTFQVLPQVTDASFQELATYFESCRTKRNAGVYDRSGQITEAEADELLEEAGAFRKLILDWMDNHCT